MQSHLRFASYRYRPFGDFIKMKNKAAILSLVGIADLIIRAIVIAKVVLLGHVM